MKQAIFALLVIISSCGFAMGQIPGYHSTIRGEILSYHAPQPDATTSLLVRSEDSTRFIEWESAMIAETGYSKQEYGSNKPGTWNPEPGTFLLLAGIDVNPADPRSWKVFVNDRHLFTISSPLDTIQKTITWPGPDGSSLVFKAKEVDKYGDFMGYLYCNLPSSMLEAGKPVRFKVVGESAGSRTWFMVFEYTAKDQVRLIPEQAVMIGEKGNHQVLRAEIVRYAEPVEVKITVAGKKLNRNLDFGYNVLYLPVPEITAETAFDFVIKAGKTLIAQESFTISPVIPRTIHLLHHSHNDIGYTHVQPEVEEIQWQNLDRALALSDSTQDFPAGSGLKWCTEVIWAFGSWYDSADPVKKEQIKRAVREGRIELNALYANELVSLCGPEELDRLLEAGRRIAKECGVDLNSAMITDIPGWSWALVPAMARSGVKYFSIGTNRGHRIGRILEEWGDRPFYWVSPSGEEKILCWIHGEGYSLFHTGLAYSIIRKRLQEGLLFGYLNKLNQTNYPYEEVMLRYNIGSDNGPVDETLPMAVREWNERYVTPKIVISTVGEAFSDFEKKHGAGLQELQGDLTGYWEDGAWSTARETHQNRRNASRLIQAQALWAMYNPENYPVDEFYAAWQNVLLYDEHTWGSWNSISEPDSPFTLQQWEIKKSFAEKAEQQSRRLFFGAMTSKPLGGPATDAIEVINTCGWPRSGLVTIYGGPNPEDVGLADDTGKLIETQLLSDGNIAFLATSVPALGSKIYKITQMQGQRSQIPSTKNQTNSKSINLETLAYSLSIDSLTGAISSFIWHPGETPSQSARLHLEKPDGVSSVPSNLVDLSVYSGLNEYLYTSGRDPEKSSTGKLLEIRTIDDGPLVKTFSMELEAPGCESLNVTIRITDALGQVEIINTVRKKKVLEPEAVRFIFPWNVAGGEMTYDLAYGFCRPEKDQLPGANRNYLAMEHWIDISGKQGGVTVVCPDAALFETGKPGMDAIVTGWVDTLPSSQTFLSYAMNNYWETNFAASQEGPCEFSYVIYPHEAFDPALAEQRAIGYRQPLITRKGGGWMKARPSLVQFMNRNLVITSVKPLDNGKALLVSVYNAGMKKEMPRLQNQGKLQVSDPDGINGKPLDPAESIPAGGIKHFIISAEHW